MKQLVLMALIAAAFASFSVGSIAAMPLASITPGVASNNDVIAVKRGSRGHHYGWTKSRGLHLGFVRGRHRGWY